MIWYDADYDYQFLLSLVEFKLVNMEKFFTSNESFADHKEDLIDIRKVLTLLEKYDTIDTSNDECLEELTEKYGELRCVEEEDTVRFQYSKTKNDEENEKAHKEFSRIHRKNELDKASTLKEVFSIIGNKISNWWD